jgi:D-sedoheptulose 7-phosphate isomerase
MKKPAETLADAVACGIKTIQSTLNLEEPLIRASQLIADCLLSGNKILACGNGGSAADAADFTTEFACKFVADRRPYPALNLTQGGSLLTAIGNDYCFEEIFARQVVAFGRKNDVLIAISTSGKSANIKRALAEAKAHELKTIALLGRDGGSALGIANIDLVVAGDSTARIQEGHKFILHVLCEICETVLPHHATREVPESEVNANLWKIPRPPVIINK